MINKRETKRMKKILGVHYTGIIKRILKEKGVLNKQGQEYSVAIISKVMSGDRNNLSIQEAIYEAVIRRKKINEKIEELRLEVSKIK